MRTTRQGKRVALIKDGQSIDYEAIACTLTV